MRDDLPVRPSVMCTSWSLDVYLTESFLEFPFLDELTYRKTVPSTRRLRS